MKRSLLSLAFFISIAATSSNRAEVTPQTQRIEVVGENTYLRFEGVPGRTYFIQQSRPGKELKEWEWLPDVRAGSGAELSIPINRSGDKKFFRLQYTDQPVPVGQTVETADFDGDGLTNLAEVSQHFTDPLGDDTDGDLLPDGFEIAHSLNPKTPGDGAKLFPGSDLTYLEAFQSGLTANANATLEDLDGDAIPNDEDADPRQRLIDWKRAPAASYAVVDLNMGSLSPSGSIHGRRPINATLNDNGMICRSAQRINGERTPSVWDGLDLPPTWKLLPDYLNAGGAPESFDDWLPSMNNAGTVFNRLQLDDGSDESDGLRTVTILWDNLTAIPRKSGAYDQNTQRDVHGRFDHVASAELVYEQPEGSETRTITVGSFSVSGSGDDVPYLETFDSYSFAPPISRTGKVLIEQSGQRRINGVLLPSNDTFGLTADPHSNDLIIVSPSRTLSDMIPMRYRNGSWEKLPMSAIMDMNSSGVGITFPFHQLWRNGSEIKLDNMLIDCGWENFKVEQVNKPGQLLGSARRSGSSDFLPVLLVPSVIEQYDLETAKTSDGIFTVTSADPRPEVTMQLAEAQVNSSGQLEVRVTGTVRDQLSEVVSGQRISQLRFSVNGEEVKIISLNFGAGQAPWTLADSRNTFDETILIPDPKPGGYEIRAETDANAAGNTGWDRVAAGLTREDDPTAPQEVFSQLSVVFSQKPSATTADALVVFFGNRPAVDGDAAFTETTADSLEFNGSLMIGDQSTACILRIKDFAESEGGASGHVSAELTYTPDGGQEISIVTSLAETGSGSLRFFPDGFQINAERNRVHAMPDLGGSQGEDIQPILMKVGVPEELALLTGFRILVNGSPHALKKFSYGGKDALYVVNSDADSRPKIFVPCVKALPAANLLPGCDLPGETIRWEMEVGGQTYLLNGTLVLPGAQRDVAAPPTAASARSLFSPAASGGWQQPGDTITFDDLVTAYKFIYTDELSQTLLRVYLQEGHEISLTDILDDYKFSYLSRPGNKALIEIESDDDDVHPGIAAQYLWRGLTKALTIYSYRNAVAVALNDDSLEIDAITAYKTQVGPAAAEVGVVAAELYLSAIGIVNEPLDWVLVVNDLSEGHYSSLTAALPLIPRGMITATKGLRIESQTGEVLARLDADSLPALQDAILTGKLETVGTVLDEYELSTFIGKLIAKDGSKIDVPKTREGLKEAMKRRVPKPGDLFIAHHDLPWEFKEWFAAHGINVNNPAFGRWIHKKDHDFWHKGAGGGDFNRFWQDFIDLEEDAGRYSTLDILAQLEVSRSSYPPTIFE